MNILSVDLIQLSPKTYLAIQIYISLSGYLLTAGLHILQVCYLGVHGICRGGKPSWFHQHRANLSTSRTREALRHVSFIHSIESMVKSGHVFISFELFLWYQHAAEMEESFALVHAITEIIHSWISTWITLFQSTEPKPTAHRSTSSRSE